MPAGAALISTSPTAAAKQKVKHVLDETNCERTYERKSSVLQFTIVVPLVCDWFNFQAVSPVVQIRF